MLIDLMAKNREAGDFMVISSSDEEGNSFSPVFYAPTVGHYDKGNAIFLTLDINLINNYKKQLKGLKPGSKAEEIIKNLISESGKDIKTKKPNAVCIN